jgi:hypothetical protein
VFNDEGGRGREYDGIDDLPTTGSVARPDNRPIIIPASIQPCAPDEYLNDKGDILDLVRQRIEERKLEPKDIRKSIAGWLRGSLAPPGRLLRRQHLPAPGLPDRPRGRPEAHQATPLQPLTCHGPRS